MSVYVDDMMAPYGRMKMCHLIADSTEELLAMVNHIGVRAKWIQFPGTYREHFDIAMSKRALAIKAGAIEITWRNYGERISARRKAEQANGEEIVRTEHRVEGSMPAAPGIRPGDAGSEELPSL